MVCGASPARGAPAGCADRRDSGHADRGRRGHGLHGNGGERQRRGHLRPQLRSAACAARVAGLPGGPGQLQHRGRGLRHARGGAEVLGGRRAAAHERELGADPRAVPARGREVARRRGGRCGQGRALQREFQRRATAAPGPGAGREERRDQRQLHSALRGGHVHDHLQERRRKHLHGADLRREAPGPLLPGVSRPDGEHLHRPARLALAGGQGARGRVDGCAAAACRPAPGPLGGHRQRNTDRGSGPGLLGRDCQEQRGRDQQHAHLRGAHRGTLGLQLPWAQRGVPIAAINGSGTHS
mmetsp:Transcript_44216/g.126200  ORF Transcript_44216/g.126200 Transcript_44216/m.126200 type:complete len:298 (+) Transcript_44216:762-1655(+)